MDTPVIAVEIPLVGDERRKHWAKLVTAVDPSKASGWAYEGEFIADGGIQDVPSNSVLLCYGETGSRANPRPQATVFLVHPDGTVSEVQAASGRAWARTLRDKVEELLGDDRPSRLGWEPSIELFSDEALATELIRRGWSLQNPDSHESTRTTDTKDE